MTYQVIARKFRPQVFEDLIGQQHVTRTLCNAIEQGRIPHAFLFTGTRGVGKTSAARVLAKALVCEQGPTPRPCNLCEHCRSITAGNHLDVFEIDGASNRGIDEIRDLREKIAYMPSKARFKLYIIDEVHMLTSEAFNALLKTLEEPPEHVKFIFATTEAHKIPSTILSRCQRFDFRKIGVGLIVDRLVDICEREGVGAERSVLTTIAREAGGSMRDAQSLLDQVISFSGGNLGGAGLSELLGLHDQGKVLILLRALFEGELPRAFTLLREIDEAGHDFGRFLLALIETLKDLIVLSVAGEAGAESLDRTAEELVELRSLAGLRSTGEVELINDLFLRGHQLLHGFEHPRLLLEILAYKAVLVDGLIPIEDLVQSVREKKKT
ncbi:MAG: DNA polymerase III, subunit gamma and tau [Deltaproteobacteria bacterium RIFOXYA12_FULL_61_11]|nr:MAG: DNA polymerase III, subunit gamma and tau [Deltaproteobacteria bacterium RIFOXYA12_FULL_61_11]